MRRKKKKILEMGGNFPLDGRSRQKNPPRTEGHDEIKIKKKKKTRRIKRKRSDYVSFGAPWARHEGRTDRDSTAGGTRSLGGCVGF